MKSIDPAPTSPALPTGPAVTFHERLAARGRLLGIGLCGAVAMILVTAGVLGSPVHRSAPTQAGPSAARATFEADFYEAGLIAESRLLATQAVASAARATFEADFYEAGLIAESRLVLATQPPVRLSEQQVLEGRLLAEARASRSSPLVGSCAQWLSEGGAFDTYWRCGDQR